MNKFTKTVLIALLLTFIPMKQWAQTARNNKVEIELSEIANPDYRYCLLAAIAQDDRLLYTVDDDNSSVILTPANHWDDSQLQIHFNRLKAEAEAEFSTYEKADKETRGDLFMAWKDRLPKDLFTLLFRQMLIENPNNRDGNQTCATSDPFCTTDMVTFHVNANPGGSCESGPYYECLTPYTDRPPFWFHMKIGVAGAFQIKMSNSSNVDIDFCCWGPFADPVTPCPNQLTYGKFIDCGSTTAHTEYCNIPSTAQVGQYYIMVITKYNQTIATDISFQKVSGVGETDCGILPPMVDNDGPYCVGETIRLSGNAQAGASYSWSGPGGWTATGQNVTRPNCTMAMAGSYTCTITVGSASNSASTNVEVIAQPTANFNATTVCKGNPTQFTSTSTTNPSGQQMTYLWNFGDGQTSTQQNPTHTYSQAGTFNVSLTVACGGNRCTHTCTKQVTVSAAPVANAGPDQTIGYGGTAQLSGSGGAGTFNYHWEPANKVTNPNAQNTQTVSLTADQTFTLTVTNPQGQCTSSDQVTIHISGSAMTVSANAFPASICQGSSSQLQANAGGGTGNFSYSWSPSTGLSATNIANPVATPTQTTTYNCTVNDGQTTQTVSVTVTVNYPEYPEETYYICPGGEYIWHDQVCTEEKDYYYETTTAQGCEKIITLHLHYYPTYDETTINEYICHGESYNFFGTNYNYSIGLADNVFHTLQTVHGCDSIVRLNLTVWPDNGVTQKEISLCPEQLPYTFYGEDYYEATDVTVWDTDMHGCDSAVRLVLTVSDYYKPNIQDEYVCSLPYEWIIKDANGSVITTKTIDAAGYYCDTLPTSSCEGIFRLDLHYQQVPDVIVEEVITCDSYIWPMTGQNLTQSDTYYHSIPLTPYPCEQIYQLNLTINTQSLLPNVHVTDSCDYVHIPWFEQDTVFTANTVYTFKGETDEGCYREQTYYIENMKYTPSVGLFDAGDAGESGAIKINDSTYTVITNTEFFSFNYSFNISETGKSKWTSCEWENTNKPTWIISNVESNEKYSSCIVHVADHSPEDVVIEFRAKSECGEDTRRLYLRSTFFGVDDIEAMPFDVSIVPNPNKGTMQLHFENMEGPVRVKVLDMRGTLIDDFETQVANGNTIHDYDMKRHAEGIYFFVISNNMRSLTRKAVIIH